MHTHCACATHASSRLLLARQSLHVTVKQLLPPFAQRRLYNNRDAQQNHTIVLRHKMSFESVLRAVFAGGNMKETVSRIRCGTGFSMRSVLVTRESLWRLCGYGATASERYLDDQVFLLHNNMTSRAILCERKYCTLRESMHYWVC